MLQRIFVFAYLFLGLLGGLKAQFDDQFYFPSKEWKPIEGVKYKDFTVKVSEEKLYGIIISPEGTPKASIIFFHGAGGNISTYMEMVRPLVNDGFLVAMIDFRAYGKSTGKPNHLNIAADGQLVFDYILENKVVKNSQILLYGASMGTVIATKLAKDNQSKIQGLILDGAISSFTDIASYYVPKEQQAVVAQFVTSPYSPKMDIKPLSIPKLFIATQTDATVPYSQTELIYGNASEPKELLVFEGGHLQALILCPEKVLTAINRMIRNP